MSTRRQAASRGSALVPLRRSRRPGRAPHSAPASAGGGGRDGDWGRAAGQRARRAAPGEGPWPGFSRDPGAAK